MFCEKCGKEMPDDANFCLACGASRNSGNVVSSNQKVEDNEVLLNVKPKFKLLYKVLPGLVSAIVIILMLVPFILSAMFAAEVISEENIVGSIIGAVLISILIVVGVSAVSLLFKKKQYDSYTYDFYRTKVIYKDSFLNISEKEVKYKYIREVTMRQTLFQRFFKLGTIILYTNAESGFANGIFILDVENPQEVYKQVKDITNG